MSGIVNTNKTPVGYELASKDQVYDLQKEFVESWPIPTDVITLRNANKFTAAISTVSALAVFWRLKPSYSVGKFLYMGLIAGVPVPVYLSTIWSDMATKNILLMKSRCPLCEQLKFSGPVAFTSVLYPAFTAGCFFLPPEFMRKQVNNQQFLQELLKFFKNKHTIVGLVLLCNIVASTGLYHKQVSEMLYVMQRSREIEPTESSMSEFM